MFRESEGFVGSCNYSIRFSCLPEFTSDFMKELLAEEEEPPLGRVASELYRATVGRFHPPILATPFSGVLLLLPARAVIRSRVCVCVCVMEGRWVGWC